MAVLDALEQLLAAGAESAAEALILPAGASGRALAANRSIRAARTMPALDRYAGVLYSGLAAQSLSAQARSSAGRSVLIFSGLFGVLTGDDAVPDYRVPAKAQLPGVGVAGTFWRPILAEVMPAFLDHGLVVDLRSSDYAGMWRSASARTITVRVVSPAPRGGYAVVSYPSKYWKGRLAAGLLEREAAGGSVHSADDLLDTWTGIGGRDGSVSTSARGTSIELRTFTATVVG